MNILEAIKRPFLNKIEVIKPTSDVPERNIDLELQTDDLVTVGFKDDKNDETHFFQNARHKKWSSLIKQRIKIEEYRKAAKEPDVSSAIDDIINESSQADQREMVIKLDIDEENEKIKNTLQDVYDEVYHKILNLDDNIFTLLEKFYIDGQLNCNLVYKKGNIKEGIQKVKILNPIYFYFNNDTNKWSYMNIETDKKMNITRVEPTDEEYDREEIIRIDSGIYDDKIILGFLENALKSINQLSTLEDLLIPMRFGRSVSRRVFNVDVGELTPTKAETYLTQVKNEFKYKKFYDVETGKISNQQHIASMVEDYWFANRNGERGTQVDTIDETGNLGELEDILYFQKKVLNAMKLPASRALRGDDEGTYGPNNEEITQAELKFYLFIKRFRKRFIPLMKGIFKRQVISTGVLTADEYMEYEEKLQFYFPGENKFFVKLRQLELVNQQDLWLNIKEDIGNDKAIYSYEYIFKTIFNMTEDDMLERFKTIDKERNNKNLKHLYKKDEDEF